MSLQPRLKTSTRWTEFPREYAEQIQNVFLENFRTYLADRELIIEGRIYPAEIILRVGIHEKGRLHQANFEVSLDYSQEKKNAIETIHVGVDAAASLLADYIEQESDEEFPRDWQGYPFNGHTVYLKYSTVNSSLEAEADKLLGITREDLVQGQDIDEDELLEKAIEQAKAEAESEGEDDGQPQMFGGGKKTSKKKKDDLH